MRRSGRDYTPPPVLGTVLKTLALVSPFAVVIVTLVNGLQASRVVIGLLVFSLAAAGVALGAIFGPDADSREKRHH